MTSTVATDVRTVDLTCGCAEAGCLELAWKMRRLLDTPKYRDGVSIMDNPASLEEWRQEHRTARKRAQRSGKQLGYLFKEVDLSVHSDDIHEINTSLPTRQGRPMSDGYLRWRQQSQLPQYPCDQHNIRTYGVFAGSKLVAYLTLYRVGELGLVSMILGHGRYLEDDIMYLLFQGVIADQAGYPGILYYNRHDSGTDGLRYYKERLGFREGHVEWV